METESLPSGELPSPSWKCHHLLASRPTLSMEIDKNRCSRAMVTLLIHRHGKRVRKS